MISVREARSRKSLFLIIHPNAFGHPPFFLAASRVVRQIEIDTVPPHAVLELSYVRENIQKRFKRAEAPILLVLPSRIQAGPRDSVLVRALLDGHLQTERNVEVRSREKNLTISLAPLPNVLSTISQTYSPSAREVVNPIVKAGRFPGAPF